MLPLHTDNLHCIQIYWSQDFSYFDSFQVYKISSNHHHVMAMEYCHGLLYQWSTFVFDYITKYHTELEDIGV